jgi:hypothetical protein
MRTPLHVEGEVGIFCRQANGFKIVLFLRFKDISKYFFYSFHEGTSYVIILFLPKAASAVTRECFKDASHHFNGPKKDAGVTIYRHTVPSSFRKPVHIATISFQKHFVIGLAAFG